MTLQIVSHQSQFSHQNHKNHVNLLIRRIQTKFQIKGIRLKLIVLSIHLIFRTKLIQLKMMNKIAKKV